MDLLDIEWFSFLNQAFDQYVARSKRLGVDLPKQSRGAHRLDRNVINYAADMAAARGQTIRSVRGVFAGASGKSWAKFPRTNSSGETTWRRMRALLVVVSRVRGRTAGRITRRSFSRGRHSSALRLTPARVRAVDTGLRDLRIIPCRYRHWTGTDAAVSGMVERITHSFEIWESGLTLSFEVESRKLLHVTWRTHMT